MMIKKETTLPVIITGRVVHGKGLGRTVGMPTANLLVSKGELPKAGVYATRATVEEKVYLAVTNIGNRPTVDEKPDTTVETYIMDFERDIYGEMLTLEVCAFLRPIQKFSNLRKVQEQVENDIQRAKEMLINQQ